MNTTFSIIIFLTAVMMACSTDTSKPVKEPGPVNHEIDQTKNELAVVSDMDLGSLQWMNPPVSFGITDSILRVTVPKGTDFFNNPENGDSTATAPLLYKEISGDFVMTALVKPDFNSQWNACALMVHIDNKHWIKFAFENSDATGKSVVSVVTREVSDDANGVVLNDLDQLWLRMIRKGNNYAMHWSQDGENYKMARLSTLPDSDGIKAGMEAQSPVGESATHEFLFFSLEQRTVEDMRKGE